MNNLLTKQQKLKMICEQEIVDYDFIFEQQKNDCAKMMRINGPFLVAEKRNGNGRLYKRNIMENAVLEYDRDYIKKGQSFGEIGHPTSLIPSYKEACIMVESFNLQPDNSNVWNGSAVVLATDSRNGILGTPNGDILASILQHGGRPGISSRGAGQINQDKVVDGYYKLVAMDIVFDPSGPGCYVDGIMESKDFMINTHGDLVEIAYSKLEKNLNVLPIHEKREYINNALARFMKNIK